ncbi:hypothetical protein [Microbulbifer sp. TRSA007]|uniref:hypothetical protein n=1 Tax=Microbulbifer sp. TRSA007 TaxID=3243384 RepID=UPI004039C428
MNRLLRNVPFLTLLGIIVTGISLYADNGSDIYIWFQRSGSLLVLCGALLTYRSIFRLGAKGVGGAPQAVFTIGKVQETYTDENGQAMAKVQKSDEDLEREYQLAMDQIAGYIGAIYAILGTVIWGYGDLIGQI